jgi:hypothetical protein
MKTANYRIIEQTEAYVLIKDIGPWNKHPSVTNDAENVVAELVPMLRGRRLEYIDSEGQRDQLLVKDGQFAGYAPVPPK